MLYIPWLQIIYTSRQRLEGNSNKNDTNNLKDLGYTLDNGHRVSKIMVHNSTLSLMILTYQYRNNLWHQAAIIQVRKSESVT